MHFYVERYFKILLFNSRLPQPSAQNYWEKISYILGLSTLQELLGIFFKKKGTCFLKLSLGSCLYFVCVERIFITNFLDVGYKVRRPLNVIVLRIRLQSCGVLNISTEILNRGVMFKSFDSMPISLS